MKISSNIPIFIVLTIFVASNALLYNYLNNDFFVDKKSTVEQEEVESVIFKLIADHETILQKRNAEILSEAQRLRDQKANITDSEELKAIEAKLKALEEEARRVQERVKNSENERDIAARQLESDMLQLSELMESNSRMGAQLDSITSEFDNYVTTLEETLVSKSVDDSERSKINRAFNNRRGLNFLNDLVGNIQANRTSLANEYINRMKTMSNEFNSGLKEIATVYNDTAYSGIKRGDGFLDTERSIDELKKGLNGFITNSSNYSDSLLKQKLDEQKNFYLNELERQLNELRAAEELKLNEALAKLKAAEDADKTAQLLEAEEEKNRRLAELEERLREELEKNANRVTEIIPTADKPIFTSWIHIPGLWSSSTTTISYTGKKIDSIAWSRENIGDNQTISFHSEYKSNGELILILYGNGRFKSWDKGVILSISNSSRSSGVIKIFINGFGDESQLLLEESISLRNGLSGDYYIYISGGKLTVEKDGKSLLKSYSIPVSLEGRLGFGNRGPNDKAFEISNFKVFKIQ